MPYRISIDPGSSGCGYAIWNEATWRRKVPPESWGVINGKGYMTWQQTVQYICQQLASIAIELPSVRVKKAYIEYPANFESVGGATTAKSGSLVKLAVFVGYCAATFEAAGIEVEYVEVNAWKGQLPKSVVSDRVHRKLGVEPGTYQSHSCDAVGIGYHAKGYRLDDGT